MAESRPKSFLQRNGLSLALLALLLLSLLGHALAGWRHEIEQSLQHQLPPPSLAEYLVSGTFLSSLFENWESEFLQMGLFVLMVVKLRQWGSSESRPFDPKQEEKHKQKVPPELQPWPVRRGGAWKWVYERSLSIALLALFALSFVAHLLSSWRQHVEEESIHGDAPTPLRQYLFDAEFWFQSFQNWQSEFLSILILVLLSIVLRQKDSPQSKQVEAPHSHTGH